MSRVFNGTSDVITLATSASIDSMVSAAQFTLAAWVYVTDTNPGNSDVVWSFGGIPGVTFYLNCSPTNGQLNGFVETVNFDMNCNSTVVSGLAANQWIHVAMVYKDTSIGGDSIAHLYYGGNEVIYAHEIAGTGGLSLTTGQPAFIGTDDQGDFLEGNIAETRAYNIALSGTQIAAVAADTTGDPNAGGAQANLVAYLHLCGTASPEPDASGNGDVGTLSGSPLPAQGVDSPGFSCVVTITSNTAVLTVITSTPNITTLSETTGFIGDTVTITGTNFGATQGSSTAKFNGITATPSFWSDTSIIVTVPNGTATGNVVVTHVSPSNGVVFTLAVPHISSLSEISGFIGDTVTITGTNFGTAQNIGSPPIGSTATFNGVTASVSSWSNTSITVTVPAGTTTGNVVITVDSLASNGVLFTLRPSLVSISPSIGGQGTTFQVTLTGSNLTGATSISVSAVGSPPASGITVSSLVVVNSTTVTATFTVSNTATLGARTVSVTAPNGVSNTLTFTIVPLDSTVTTVITNNQNPSFIGDVVSFRITVVDTSRLNTPTGTIDLLDGSTYLAAGLHLVNGQVNFDVSSLTVGTHTITANYNPTGIFLPSTGSLSDVVSNFPPRVTTNGPFPNRIVLNCYPLAGPFVSAVLGLFDPRRDMTIYADGVLLKVVSFSFDSINNRYLIYTSTQFDLQGVVQVVHHMPQPPFFGKYRTTVVLTADINPTYLTHSVTFTATVRSTSTPIFTPGAPLGAIQFYDGATLLGTVTLDNTGVAQFTTSSLSSGNHTITAQYVQSGPPIFGLSSATTTEVIVTFSTMTVLVVT